MVVCLRRFFYFSETSQVKELANQRDSNATRTRLKLIFPLFGMFFYRFILSNIIAMLVSKIAKYFYLFFVDL